MRVVRRRVAPRLVSVLLTAGLTLSTGAATASTTARRVVDVAGIAPSDFTRPTEIANELAPISALDYVVSLGEDEGEPLRIEVKLLPRTKEIQWNGGTTETVVAQFTAFTREEMVELAYDFYAQDDAGNVWYFGEDVFNFERGSVVNQDGTWLAGRDGPPGLLMPADPRVGDVYHPENIPGLVFEEDEVVSITERVQGPSGPIEGVLKVREEQMDGAVEHKYWAPGYGEFRAVVTGVEDVRVRMALPIDAQSAEVPHALTTLQGISATAFDLAGRGDWDALTRALSPARKTWREYDASERRIPRRFVSTVEQRIAGLDAAAKEKDVRVARRAAVALELALIDVMTTHGSSEDAARIAALRRRAGIERGAAAANTQAVIEALEARVAGAPV